MSKKVKISLSRTQMEGLELLLRWSKKTYDPSSMIEKLIDHHVDELSKRLTRRADELSLIKKKGYALTLSEPEALAFHLWYYNMSWLLTDYTYELMVAKLVADHINKEFA